MAQFGTFTFVIEDTESNEPVKIQIKKRRLKTSFRNR